MSLPINLVGTSTDHDFESGQTFNFLVLKIGEYQFRALVEDSVMKRAVHELRKQEGLVEEPVVKLGGRREPVRRVEDPVVLDQPLVGSSVWVSEDAAEAEEPAALTEEDFDEGQID